MGDCRSFDEDYSLHLNEGEGPYGQVGKVVCTEHSAAAWSVKSYCI
jgi:hypothetical protein